MPGKRYKAGCIVGQIPVLHKENKIKFLHAQPKFKNAIKMLVRFVQILLIANKIIRINAKKVCDMYCLPKLRFSFTYPSLPFKVTWIDSIVHQGKKQITIKAIAAMNPIS